MRLNPRVTSCLTTIIGSVGRKTFCCIPEQVPEYYKLMGYEEEQFPAFTPYAPPLLDLPLEEGAAEELPWPHASGLQLPVSEWLAMPDACLLPSQTNLPIGIGLLQLSLPQELANLTCC